MLSLSWLLVVVINFACKQDAEQSPVSSVFLQIYPVQAEKGVSLTPSFSWGVSENATTYSLLVAIDSTFSNTVILKEGLTNTQYVAESTLENNTRYYWKVQAINAVGTRMASNAGQFFRTIALPAAPSPLISSYYVSPSGEDNPGKGSISDPLQTLAYATTLIPAGEGDTIILTAGTFIETEPAIIPLGVNVMGAGENISILSSTGVTGTFAFEKTSREYRNSYTGALIQLVSPYKSGNTALAPTLGNQTLSGFTIDGNNKMLKAGIWVANRNNITMHHITFNNLEIRGAVFAPGEKEWYKEPVYYMTDIKISDCTFLNCGKDMADETLGNLCIAQLDGAEISNITINDDQGYGIKFIYDGFFKNTKIHDCSINLNEIDAKWGEDIAIEVWNLGPGNEIYNIDCNTWLSVVNHSEMFGKPQGTENMKIYNIEMIDKDGVSSKEAIEIGTPGVEIYDSYFENKGIGIALWNMRKNNITIRNNIFHNTTLHYNWAEGSAVFVANSQLWDFTSINIYNNVFNNFVTGIFLKQETDQSKMDTIQVINNVFLNISTANIKISGSVNNILVKNNLKNDENVPPFITGTPISIIENDNLTGNPGFTLTGNYWDTWYKPTSASSLVVDHGIDVGLPYSGSSPDIGRWEYFSEF